MGNTGTTCRRPHWHLAGLSDSSWAGGAMSGDQQASNARCKPPTHSPLPSTGGDLDDFKFEIPGNFAGGEVHLDGRPCRMILRRPHFQSSSLPPGTCVAHLDSANNYTIPGAPCNTIYTDRKERHSTSVHWCPVTLRRSTKLIHDLRSRPLGRLPMRDKRRSSAPIHLPSLSHSAVRSPAAMHARQVRSTILFLSPRHQ
jgi:hypothetical protein